MRVVPIEVLNSEDKVIVRFETRFGTGVASWYYPPKVLLKEVYAEMDVLPKLVLGVNLEILDIPLPHSITATQFNTCICGTVERVDEDEIVCIRLSDDCILLVDATSQNLKEKQSIRLTIAHADLLVSTME